LRRFRGDVDVHTDLQRDVIAAGVGFLAEVHLLARDGFLNETIANVFGLGQLSLVKADIIVGLFDNGIIKGYVYAPANPQPIVKDLENWPPELTNVTTAYRSIGNNWYLFELRH
jgi:hypothetical protein